MTSSDELPMPCFNARGWDSSGSDSKSRLKCRSRNFQALRISCFNFNIRFPIRMHGLWFRGSIIARVAMLRKSMTSLSLGFHDILGQLPHVYQPAFSKPFDHRIMWSHSVPPMRSFNILFGRLFCMCQRSFDTQHA